MIRGKKNEVVLVLTTYPADGDPGRLARTLVSERLAACVSAQPEMLSVYRWEDVMEQKSEFQILIKTTFEQVDALEIRLTELHPYDMPEFLVYPVLSRQSAYLDWVAKAAGRDPVTPSES